MLNDIIINRLVYTSHLIGINQSRCLRMRLNINTCNGCLDQCPAGAIRIDERGVNITRGTCSECMLCVSVCPSGSFEINKFDFYSVIKRLNDIDSPVMGCNLKPYLNAHVKTPCLGFLSEEHFVVLSIAIENPLQINLTECSNCRNGYIVSFLKKGLEDVERKIQVPLRDKIKTVEEKEDLDYHDISLGRRDLFKMIKNLTLRESTSLFQNADAGENLQPYSDKALPLKNELLNKTLDLSNEETKEAILVNYYYDLSVDKECNHCFACVGMCPTGALKTSCQESRQGLLFNSSLCNGCGLCANFCKINVIRIKQGLTGKNPFVFNHI